MGPAQHTGRHEHAAAYRACERLLRDLLPRAVDHRRPSPGGPHDPPAPGPLRVQDAVPGDPQLRLRARAGAAHLRGRAAAVGAAAACPHAAAGLRLKTAVLLCDHCGKSVVTGSSLSGVTPRQRALCVWGLGSILPHPLSLESRHRKKEAQTQAARGRHRAGSGAATGRAWSPRSGPDQGHS